MLPSISETFFVPNRNSGPSGTNSLQSLPQPLATTSLLSSLRIGLVQTFHINKIRQYLSLCLASFPQHKVFKVHPCCSMC